MTERRRTDPLPLGGDEPYSKGLMARALIRAGVTPSRAYEVARLIEQDLGDRRQDRVDLARVEELAMSVLGDDLDRRRLDLDQEGVCIDRLQVGAELVSIGQVARDVHNLRAVLLGEQAGEPLVRLLARGREDCDALALDRLGGPRPHLGGDDGEVGLDLVDGSAQLVVSRPLLRARQDDEVGNEHAVGVQVAGE